MFRRNISAAVGVVGTIFYTLFLVYVIFADWADFLKLKPNEWGDFLAGSLGPLALFWLILSFFQQSRELQHSVEALNLQAEELRNSVTHQRELVEVSRKALDHERQVIEDQRSLELAKIRPKFLCERSNDRSSVLSFSEACRVTNVGGAGLNVSVFSSHFAHWATGESHIFQVGTMQNSIERTLTEISFQDAKGNSFTERLNSPW
jgi:hypothetical protein